MEAAYRSALEYFGEDTKSSPDTFFSVFQNFGLTMDAAKKQLEREIEAQKRNAERAGSKPPGIAPKPGAGPAAGDGRGVMDDIIHNMRTGDAFKKNLRKTNIERSNTNLQENEANAGKDGAKGDGRAI